MSRWPTKRDLARLKAEAAFQAGLPWGWIRFECRGCGADYCTRNNGLLHDPCPACGMHVGHIERITVS